MTNINKKYYSYLLLCVPFIYKMQSHLTISKQFNVSAKVETVLSKALGNKKVTIRNWSDSLWDNNTIHRLKPCGQVSL
jgi:hypothetical protein